MIESVMGLLLDDVDPLEIEVVKEERRSENMEYELRVVTELDWA